MAITILYAIFFFVQRHGFEQNLVSFISRHSKSSCRAQTRTRRDDLLPLHLAELRKKVKIYRRCPTMRFAINWWNYDSQRVDYDTENCVSTLHVICHMITR